MRFKPLMDRLIVKKLPKDVSDGGIALPNKVADNGDRGEVVAAGPGRRRADGDGVVPMTVKVGDKVIFDRSTNQTIELHDEVYLVLYEAEIIGIL